LWADEPAVDLCGAFAATRPALFATFADFLDVLSATVFTPLIDGSIV
jgi:hypothetical protein